MKLKFYYLIIFLVAVVNLHSQQNTRWEIVNYEPPTTANYSLPPWSGIDIWFFDNNIGYSIGDDYLLFKTTNGGISWNQCFLVDSSDFYFYGLFNDSNGVIIGKDTLSRYFYLLTNDSGVSWEKYYFQFRITQDGKKPIYSSRGGFYVSTLDKKLFFIRFNGNISEETFNLDGYIDIKSKYKIISLFVNSSGQLTALDEYGFIYKKNSDNDFMWNMYNVTPDLQHELGIILSSDNIINTSHNGSQFSIWKHVLSNGVYNIESKFISQEVNYPKMLRLSNEVVLLIGNNLNNSCNLLRTEDSGETWNFINVNSSNIFHFGYIKDNKPYLVGNDSLYTSDDLGLSWYVPSRIIGTSDTLRSVWFISEDRGFAVGNEEKMLFKTFDGFNTNERIKYNDSGYININFFNCIYFKNNETGYLFSDGNIPMKSINSGQTWFSDTTLMNGPTISYVTGVRFVENGVITSHTHGRINHWITSNNINLIVSDEPNPCLDIDLLYEDNLINYDIFGSFANRRFSKNSNFIPFPRNYNQQTIDLFLETVPFRNENFNCVKFINNKGFVVSSYGVIYQSNDTGSSWSINSEWLKPLYNINYETPNNIYIVGDGIILNSRDSGQTWQQQYIDGVSPDEMNNKKLRSVFVKGSYVYAVGVDNIILKGTIVSPPPANKIRINDKKSISNNKLYPNPVTEYLILEEFDINSKVKIIDNSGKILFDMLPENNKIDIRELPVGSYILNIESKNKIQSLKFIKK